MHQHLLFSRTNSMASSSSERDWNTQDRVPSAFDDESSTGFLPRQLPIELRKIFFLPLLQLLLNVGTLCQQRRDGPLNRAFIER
jgi:hypothetical protein